MSTRKPKKSSKPRGGARPGSGRPKVDEPLKSRTIRVSDADWDAWASAAASSGKNHNQWLRDVCNRSAKRAK